MTIGDPCGNFEKTLTWHRENMACITPGVGDSWCGVPGSFWWYEKNEEKKPAKYQQIRIKRLLPLFPKKEKKVDLEDFNERCFFFKRIFCGCFFRHRHGQQILLRNNRDLFFVWGTKLVELEYRPCFLPFALWKSDAPRLFWVLTWT